jgi:hypothetical protein
MCSVVPVHQAVPSVNAQTPHARPVPTMHHPDQRRHKVTGQPPPGGTPQADRRRRNAIAPNPLGGRWLGWDPEPEMENLYG